MLLRNKKTGETGYYLHTHRDHNTGTLKVAVLKDGVPFSEFKPHEPIYDYDSLAELNDEWEDYKPKEPLIKDEKIRKAIRAWAEANSRDLFRVINEHFNCCKIIGYTDGGNASCDRIEFGTTIAGIDKNYYYTIEELCGEEEE